MRVRRRVLHFQAYRKSIPPRARNLYSVPHEQVVVLTGEGNGKGVSLIFLDILRRIVLDV